MSKAVHGEVVYGVGIVISGVYECVVEGCMVSIILKYKELEVIIDSFID